VRENAIKNFMHEKYSKKSSKNFVCEKYWEIWQKNRARNCSIGKFDRKIQCKIARLENVVQKFKTKYVAEDFNKKFQRLKLCIPRNAFRISVTNFQKSE
jgi:hypothetical protein